MNITKNKNSIQHSTLKCLIIFSIIILLLMYTSQILFLKLFYERYQIKNIENVITKLTKETYTSEELEKLAYKNNICMEYIYNDNVYLFNSLNNNCLLTNKNTNITTFIKNFISNNKTKEIIKLNNPRKFQKN